MTRERRAIDTTTASISSLSLSLALISVVETRRTRDHPPILIFRDVVRRSVNWLKCTELRKPQDVGEKKGAILSTWLETCEFLAKVEQTLRVGSVSTVDFFLRLVIYSVAPGKFRTVAREPRWSKARFAVYSPRKLARKVYV